MTTTTIALLLLGFGLAAWLCRARGKAMAFVRSASGRPIPCPPITAGTSLCGPWSRL
jgi:ABC-type molybdate transport system permease subunit